jgi:outer membrane protein assembly factor BamD
VIPATALFTGATRRAPILWLLLAAICVALIAGCGTATTKVDPTVGWSAEQLYNDAKAQIADRSWNDARDRLNAIEARYPFGVYAQQALMDLAYVNWKDGENEQALAACDRFEQLFPNHPGSDYMLYLKGLINFTPPSAFMSNLTGQNPAERDPKALRASYDAFNTLVKRYPQSKYTPDAQLRLAWLVNTIAMNEVFVARYYYDRGAYIAAANRAQIVITDFEGVAANEDALYVMVISYDKLGLTQLRDDAQRVLERNFPNSKLMANGFPPTAKAWWNPSKYL